jgi:hypothetical protein
VSAVVLVGPEIWFLVREWPPTANVGILLLGGLAVGAYLVWDLLFTPASEVRIEGDQVVLRSQVRELRVSSNEVTYLKADYLGRPELGWRQGKQRLNISGAQLHALVDHLRRENPTLTTSGLIGL